MYLSKSPFLISDIYNNNKIIIYDYIKLTLLINLKILKNGLFIKLSI